MRILYFVHNLNDPAVAKRLMMLEAAGAEARVTGFWRGSPPPACIGGVPALALGPTFDARLAQRAMMSLGHALSPQPILDWVGEADIFMARNLEMLAVAAAARGRLKKRPSLVYEVLDIHRLLLSRGPAGLGLRTVEEMLMRDVDLLVVSSPAFVREYFEPFQFHRRRPAVALLENKSVQLQPVAQPARQEIAPGPPWRIGWLGMIRCRRSLGLLNALAGRRPDLLQVQIFGRPTKEIAQDLQQAPHVCFGGAYRPEDLPQLYGQVHFNWAIDYYEDGANSRWLLPNRIYEGGRYNAVPLAPAGTETANWLSKLGLGVLMKEPERELEAFLQDLTPSRYLELRAACRAAPREAFIADQADCDRLGQLLAHTLGAAPPATKKAEAAPAAVLAGR